MTLQDIQQDCIQALMASRLTDKQSEAIVRAVDSIIGQGEPRAIQDYRQPWEMMNALTKVDMPQEQAIAITATTWRLAMFYKHGIDIGMRAGDYPKGEPDADDETEHERQMRIGEKIIAEYSGMLAELAKR